MNEQMNMASYKSRFNGMYNINMDSTVSGTMNDKINMGSTTSGSMNVTT